MCRYGWLGLREFGREFESAAPPHDSGSKWISTVQTRAPNDVIYSRWQRPYWDAFTSLFYSGRKQRCVVHLFLNTFTLVHKMFVLPWETVFAYRTFRFTRKTFALAQETFSMKLCLLAEFLRNSAFTLEFLRETFLFAKCLCFPDKFCITCKSFAFPQITFICKTFALPNKFASSQNFCVLSWNLAFAHKECHMF